MIMASSTNSKIKDTNPLIQQRGGCELRRDRKRRWRTSSEGTRDAAHKDGLAGIQGLRSIHHKVTVAQVPRSNLHLIKVKLKLKSLPKPWKWPCGDQWGDLTGLSLMVGLETHR